MESAEKNAGMPFRGLPVPAWLLPLLRGWKEADAARGISHVVNYPDKYQGRPLGHLNRAWATTLAAANIDRRLRPYDLRHAWATLAKRAGVDAKVASLLMGHADTRMLTEVYSG